MSLGSVTVNALNLSQGAFPTIEKYFLFIGVATENLNTIIYVNTDTDLDDALGAGSFELKNQVAAARANGGQNWSAVVMPVAEGADFHDAVDTAMANDIQVEAIVKTVPISTLGDLNSLQEKAELILSQYGRRVFFIGTMRGIDAETETWAEYIAALGLLVNGVAAQRVSIAPKIFPYSMGIYAGRLCHNSTSVADTPMRVSTGPLIGVAQTDLPLDVDGVVYSNAHAEALNNLRFSVPQMYADYPGVYWSDGQTLDAPTGDYTVIENLRVIDKAARAVRLVLITLLGDRKFNSTSIGEAWAISKLMRPLYEMSRSYVFQGVQFPAELKSPQAGDVAIQWTTRTNVAIYLIARPFEIPKQLTANIVLDLSAPTA